MGSHTWTEQCPYCGFEEMMVSTYDTLDFEIICQICGYTKWPEQKAPDSSDVELAKRALSEMDAKEIQKAVELHYEDNIPLVVRLKGKFLNKD